jgi:O-antigen ligase
LFFISLAIVLLLIPKIFSKPRWGILVLLFLVPFERIPSWDIPYEWGITIRLSQITGLIILAAFLYRLIKFGEVRAKLIAHLKNPVIISVLVYLLVVLISVFWSTDPQKSLLVFFFTGFTFMIGFFFYYFISSRSDFKSIEKVLFYSVLILSVFGIWQFFADSLGLSAFWTGLMERYQNPVLGFPRVQSFGLEPLFMVNFLLIPLAIFSSLFLTGESSLSKLKQVSILILIVVNIVLAVSRGGYIASVFLVVFLLVVLIKQYSWRRFLKFLSLILVGILLAGSLIFLSSYLVFEDNTGAEKLIKHSSQIETEKGDNLGTREGTWVWAYQAFKENPVLGVGAGGFGSWMIERGYPGRQRVVNNELLEILTETGILGFLPILSAVLFLIVGAIKAIKKSKDRYLIALMVGMLAWFLAAGAQYMTFSTLYITHFWVGFGLFLAVNKLILRPNKEGAKR